jgi:flagellar biosynthesis protein FliQ
MDAGWVIYMGRHTLETALMLSAPVLLVCMTTGIILSLFQAITSVRDMSLTIVPKLIAMGISLLIFGGWMLQLAVKFSYEIFTQLERYGQ